jgi:alpha-glucosidase
VARTLADARFLIALAPLVAGCSSSSAPAPAPDAAADSAPDAAADSATDAASDSATDVEAGPPTCRGVPLPEGDLHPEADGRTLVVPCAALGVDLRVTAVDPQILRVRHVDPAEPARASFAVVDRPWPDPGARFGADATTARVCTDGLLLEIDRASCRLRATTAEGTVILEDASGGAYVRDAATGARGVVRETPAGERFFGFGEKTGPLDKRGRAMTFWNTDAYVDASKGYPPGADPLYQSIPFFVGLRGAVAYGLFLDDTWRVTADMAKSDNGKYALTAAGGELDEYLIAGPAIASVVERYTALTGRIPMPPRWALGYQQSRWGYSEAQLRAVATALRTTYRIPADGLWLDIQHMDGFRSWTWDASAFPDPGKLVSDLASQGFATTVIVDPGIKADPAWDVYQAAVSGGHLLTSGGAPYVGEVWPGASVFPDFSAAKTRAWWGTLVKRDLDRGVRGVWVDMNEPSDFTKGNGGTVPSTLVADGDGATAGATTMAAMHNVYGLNEARATYEGMRAAKAARPFVLTRAGYAGIQRYAAVWTGDAPSSWPTLRETLPMMLGMGLSGVPFVGSDVGGYSGEATPEMFARWFELGSISPFFRGHTMNTGAAQEPWAFGTEVTDISREADELRYALLPYWYSLFAEASRSGAPILRPLVYDFQADATAAAIDDQALLGPWIMAAPLLSQGASTRDVYFPAGRWFQWHSGAVIEGPKTVTLDTQTLASLPLWVREGAIVPREAPALWTAQPKSTVLHLDVWPAATATTFTRYEDDGASRDWESGVFARTVYTLVRTSTGARLTTAPRTGTYVPAARPLIVKVQRVDHLPTAVMANGVAVPNVGSLAAIDAAAAAGTSAWTWDERDLALVVTVPDRDGLDLDFAYDPSLVALAPPVSMELWVTVPTGTPTGAPIDFASSANGWSHQPLGWDGARAHAVVSVPRGEWFFYKYSRGGWSTVEKWPGCVEATNRYARGVAHPAKEDTVYGWADWCP